MTDAQLVAGALQGKEESLSELLRRYRAPVYAWIRHHGFGRPDAEDLTQETLVRACSRLARFDPAKGRFVTWLFEIANNLCRMQLRRLARHPSPESIETVFPEPSCDGPEEVLGRNRCEEVLWQAVCRLPEELRSVTVLFFYWGMNRCEAARFLRVSEGTVRYRLRCSCRLLRRYLAERGITSARQLTA